MPTHQLSNLLLEWTTAIIEINKYQVKKLLQKEPELLWTPIPHTLDEFSEMKKKLIDIRCLGTSFQPVSAIQFICLFLNSFDNHNIECFQLLSFLIDQSTLHDLDTRHWGECNNSTCHLVCFLENQSIAKLLIEKDVSMTVKNDLGYQPKDVISSSIFLNELVKLQQETIVKIKKVRPNYSTPDRFKHLREMAIQDTGLSRSASTPYKISLRDESRFFRKGLVSESKKKVLTEDEKKHIELAKSRRQMEVAVLVEKLAVKNNPLFQKYEKRSYTAPLPKKLDASMFLNQTSSDPILDLPVARMVIRDQPIQQEPEEESEQQHYIPEPEKLTEQESESEQEPERPEDDEDTQKRKSRMRSSIIIIPHTQSVPEHKRLSRMRNSIIVVPQQPEEQEPEESTKISRIRNSIIIVPQSQNPTSLEEHQEHQNEQHEDLVIEHAQSSDEEYTMDTDDEDHHSSIHQDDAFSAQSVHGDTPTPPTLSKSISNDSGIDLLEGARIQYSEETIIEPLTIQPLTVQSSTAQSPTVQSSTAQSPTVQSSTAQSPTVQSSTAQSPTAQSPTIQSPTIQSPTIQSPTVQSPTAQYHTAQSPTVQSPTVQSPTVQSPTAQSPTILSPTIRSSSILASSIHSPTMRSPTLRSPTARTPTSPTFSVHTPTSATFETIQEIIPGDEEITTTKRLSGSQKAAWTMSMSSWAAILDREFNTAEPKKKQEKKFPLEDDPIQEERPLVPEEELLEAPLQIPEESLHMTAETSEEYQPTDVIMSRQPVLIQNPLPFHYGFGKLYIYVNGIQDILLPLPKNQTYVRCVVSDGRYEYMSRYELLQENIPFNYECVIDTYPEMVITVSLHVRPDYVMKSRLPFSRFFSYKKKKKDKLSRYVHKDDGAIGQARFALTHMLPAITERSYITGFHCFNAWYVRSFRERHRLRKLNRRRRDVLKVVGNFDVEMLFLPYQRINQRQVFPRSLRDYNALVERYYTLENANADINDTY